MSFVASPAVRAYAAQKGVDLGALAAATGRATLTREDVDRRLSGDSPAAPAESNHSRYWDVDHGQFGLVTREPMPRLAQVAAANLSSRDAQATTRECELVRRSMGTPIASVRLTSRPALRTRRVKLRRVKNRT